MPVSDDTILRQLKRQVASLNAKTTVSIHLGLRISRFVSHWIAGLIFAK